MIAYGKATPDLSNIILVVVNLDPHHGQSGWVRLPIAELGLGSGPGESYQVHDLISDARYLWHGESNFVQLDPIGQPRAHLPGPAEGEDRARFRLFHVIRSGRERSDPEEGAMSLPSPEGGLQALFASDGRALEARDPAGVSRRQRWFAGKARELESTRIVDATAPAALGGISPLGPRRCIVSDRDAGALPLTLAVAGGVEADRLTRKAPGGRSLARIDPVGLVFDALADARACRVLLEAIEQGRRSRRTSAEWSPNHSRVRKSPRPGRAGVAAPSRFRRAEQLGGPLSATA